MFNANNVNAALQLVNTATDEGHTAYTFSCNLQVICAGETLWGYTNAGDTVTVTAITVLDNGDYCDIYVQLDEAVIVYTDTAFAQVISNVLGVAVDYTEQGMQDDGLVSMET